MTASGPPATAPRARTAAIHPGLGRCRAEARPEHESARRSGKAAGVPPATCPARSRCRQRRAAPRSRDSSRDNHSRDNHSRDKPQDGSQDGSRVNPPAVLTTTVAGTARRLPPGRGPGTGCPKCTAEATVHSVTEGRIPTRRRVVDPAGRDRRQIPTEGYASLPTIGLWSSTADQWSLTADRRCRST